MKINNDLQLQKQGEVDYSKFTDKAKVYDLVEFLVTLSDALSFGEDNEILELYYKEKQALFSIFNRLSQYY